MRRPAMKAFLLALFLIAGLSGPVSGDERITDFRVTAVVGEDSSVTVREEITITVEGKEGTYDARSGECTVTGGGVVTWKE